MLTNYLKIAFRVMLRKKLYSLINILGLATGMAFCLLILLFVKDEFSFDKFHKNNARIYRVHKVQYKNNQPDLETKSILLPMPLTEALKAEIPEIEQATPYTSRTAYVNYEKNTYQQWIHYVTEDFTEMFTIQYVAGNSSHPLSDLKSMVISRSVAEKFFGVANPIGKTLVVKRDSVDEEYTVTAVFEDLPENSSLNCDMLIRFENFPPYYKQKNDWYAYYTYVFVQFFPETNPEAVEEKIHRFTEKYFGDEINAARERGEVTAQQKYTSLEFTRLTNIHFDNTVNWHKVSNIQYSYILGGIALLTLLIACINYVLLSLTSSSSRNKEVGIRKVLGASRRTVRWQFWGETLMLAFIAMLLALTLAQVFLSTFNDFTGKNLQFSFSQHIEVIAGMVLLAMLTGLLAGSYPAEVLSRFVPAKVLKNHTSQKYNAGFARYLIIFQFAVCTFFIACTLVMYQQMQYISEKDLGFDKEQVVVIPTANAQGIAEKAILERFKNDLAHDQRIVGITGLSPDFGKSLWTTTSDFNDEKLTIYHFNVDRNFFETMGIEFVQGSTFSESSIRDSVRQVVINEALAAKIDHAPLIGSSVPSQPDTEIMGVIKDFNFYSLEQNIGPMSFQEGSHLGNILIKIAPQQIPSALRTLEATWKKNVHGEPFRYSFLDDDLAASYENYERWMHIMSASTLFGILIACLGLFGLNGLMAVNRTKEIGIRKVLGASVQHILLLLNRQTLFLMIIATIIGIPLAWYAMQQWLENFAYRITIGWEIGLVSVLTGVALVVVTMSYHSVKVALTNPAKSLRYE